MGKTSSQRGIRSSLPLGSRQLLHGSVGRHLRSQLSLMERIERECALTRHQALTASREVDWNNNRDTRFHIWVASLTTLAPTRLSHLSLKMHQRELAESLPTFSLLHFHSSALRSMAQHNDLPFHSGATPGRLRSRNLEAMAPGLR